MVSNFLSEHAIWRTATLISSVLSFRPKARKLLLLLLLLLLLFTEIEFPLGGIPKILFMTLFRYSLKNY